MRSRHTRKRWHAYTHPDECRSPAWKKAASWRISHSRGIPIPMSKRWRGAATRCRIAEQDEGGADARLREGLRPENRRWAGRTQGNGHLAATPKGHTRSANSVGWRQPARSWVRSLPFGERTVSGRDRRKSATRRRPRRYCVRSADQDRERAAGLRKGFLCAGLWARSCRAA